MAPLVSIITPCGPRHAAHVRTAAASVQWQSLAHRCEHIIACDGGADVAPMDGITILPSDGERRGPAITRNRAIGAARGAFILPLDADDYLLPNTVAHMLRAYASGQHGYIYGDTFTHERDGRFVIRSAPDYVQQTYTGDAGKVGGMDTHNLHVVTALIPTHLARRVGGYDEGVDAWEDWSFHLRLAIAGICGKRIPIPLFTYRVYEGERMTAFYGGDPELMEKVLVRYRNKEGQIIMASCCGGDSGLAQQALSALADIAAPNAAPMDGGKVRVEYLGPERGSVSWGPVPGHTTPIRLGNNALHRYADVSPDELEWLKQRQIPIRVVPTFDGPEPPAPLPILDAADVLTPDAAQIKALRPRSRAVA